MKKVFKIVVGIFIAGISIKILFLGVFSSRKQIVNPEGEVVNGSIAELKKLSWATWSNEF